MHSPMARRSTDTIHGDVAIAAAAAATAAAAAAETARDVRVVKLA